MVKASWGRAAVSITAASSALSAVLALTAPGQPAAVHNSEIAGARLALVTSQALIMSGTAMPHVTTEWMDFVSSNFIDPTIGDGYVNTPLRTPEQFRPITGRFSLSLNKSTEIGWRILNFVVHGLIAADKMTGGPGDPIAVFGYSQSSWLAAIEKQRLLAEQALQPDFPPISFVMLADPVRPNGGLFSRSRGFGLVRWTSVFSAPTETPFPTYDIARQYDLFADFPAYPLNLLADVNAAFGLLNHDYSSVTLNPADPKYDPNTVVQHYGDTTYYLIPSTLPMLYPLRWAGLNRIADAIEPALKVLVELGYDRQTPYGQYTPFKLFPQVDRAALKSDLQAAFSQGLEVLNSVPAQAKSIAMQGKPSPSAASAPAAPAAPSSEPDLSAKEVTDIVSGVPDDTRPTARNPVPPGRIGGSERDGGRDARQSRAITRDNGAGRVRPQRHVSREGST